MGGGGWLAQLGLALTLIRFICTIVSVCPTDTCTSDFRQRRYCLCLLIAGILAAVLTPVLIKLFRK